MFQNINEDVQSNYDISFFVNLFVFYNTCFVRAVKIKNIYFL